MGVAAVDMAPMVEPLAALLPRLRPGMVARRQGLVAGGGDHAQQGTVGVVEGHAVLLAGLVQRLAVAKIALGAGDVEQGVVGALLAQDRVEQAA